jgi:hypothetical protein
MVAEVVLKQHGCSTGTKKLATLHKWGNNGKLKCM